MKLTQPADILVVDDNAMNRKLLEAVLNGQRFNVRMANDGPSAIEEVMRQVPDLILLDIQMPHMNGYDVCRSLKSRPESEHVPIIFISARGDVFDKVRGFESGGVDYITKPFHTAEVLARVNTHLTIQFLQRDLKDRISDLDAFAHTVAHDLKNPLALIIGYAEYVSSYLPELEEEQVTELLGNVRKASYKSINIINELLLLASVRKEAIDLEPLNMPRIITQAKKRLVTMLEESGASVSISDEWDQAYGYAPWIEEVWSNYISNAVKYGGAPPQLSLGSTRINEGSVRFWIKDNGNGLSDTDQAKLFGEFTRLNKAKGEGTGLGLSIVKRIVERLGGEVGVESCLGQGSTFYFTLPAAT